MITKLGIYSLLAGSFIGVFSGVSNFMEIKNFWADLTISKIIGGSNSEAVITLLDTVVTQNSLNFLIYELPFFCFLLGVGFILLIISMFIKNY